MLFVCYPKCKTYQKARVWLDDKGIAYDFRDIKEQNPSLAELKEWHAKSGLPLRKFFNTSGLKYKELNLSSRLAEISDEEQFVLLVSDGMLVKRPIVVGGGFVLVGFKQEDWEKRLL